MPLISVPPAAIVRTAPEIYFWTQLGFGGKRVWIWCGHEVDQAVYYENVAAYMRAGQRGKCPKGIY